MPRKKISHFIILSIIFILVMLPWGSSVLGESTPETRVEQGTPYLIGPNDILRIFVWKEPELTLEVTVLPSGGITFPLIGEITAQGRTLTELKTVITEKLEQYVSAPEVTVIVLQSLSRRVYIIGKVNRVVPFALEQDMTVLQALSTAGGFAEWADEKNILIVRREGGKEVQFHFNYKEFTSGKNPEQNIILKPNDTIVVP